MVITNRHPCKTRLSEISASPDRIATTWCESSGTVVLRTIAIPHLLKEYERRDALTRRWYHEGRAADAKRNLIAVLVGGFSVIVLLLVWTFLI